ncbi:MAG TPA: diacylglycerol kinase family protein [Vicinamibacterales bacterium]
MNDTDQRVAVVVNPISGTGGRVEKARARAEHAAALLVARGLEPEIFLTERPGHARELAASALARGASLVLAWGGDGTVNEVASALAFRDAALAVIPSGSGNGLARELGIPLDPAGAFAVAFEGRELVMDAGELDGHLFFNIAGIGLDARVAHEFSAGGLVRRGLARYLEITARELFTYTPDEHTIVTDGDSLRERALLIAIANGSQYGNGAIVAPAARVDDGKLDVVVIAHRSPLRALVQVPRLFQGRIADLPGVTIRQAADVEITSARQVLYHVDGEPFVGGASIRARIRPRAVHIKVPRRYKLGQMS